MGLTFIARLMFAKNLAFDQNLRDLVDSGFVSFSREDQGPILTEAGRNAINAVLLMGPGASTSPNWIQEGVLVLAREKLAESATK